MIKVESPITVPRRKSVTGRRLGGCILFKTNFPLGNVTKGGFENDDNRHETRNANEGEADVRAGEDGPGFHVGCLN